MEWPFSYQRFYGEFPKPKRVASFPGTVGKKLRTLVKQGSQRFLRFERRVIGSGAQDRRPNSPTEVNRQADSCETIHLFLPQSSLLLSAKMRLVEPDIRAHPAFYSRVR